MAGAGSVRERAGGGAGGRRVRRVVPRALALGAAAAVAACWGADPAAPGEDPPRFQGIVTVGPGTAPDPAATAGIWVAVEVQGDERQLGLVIWPYTDIRVRTSGGQLGPGGLEDLVPGTRVRAWTTDAEYLSIPPQYDATRIEVTSR